MRVPPNIYKYFLFFIILCPVLLCSCAPSVREERLFLSDSFYLLPCSADSSIAEAEAKKDQFKKFDIKPRANIKSLVGSEGSYIWLRAEFVLPERLKEHNLGLFVNNLHFAANVWINGAYAGSSGEFPPNEWCDLFMCQGFYFLKDRVHQNVPNTLYIKVWAHGKADISDIIFIGTEDDVIRAVEMTSFTHSRILLLLEGCLLLAYILFILFYLGRKKEKANLFFSQLALFTTFFIVPFFTAELPLFKYHRLPYYEFLKFFLCISFYIIIFFLPHFISSFVHKEFSKFEKYLMAFILLFQVILTLLAPNYNFLMAICPFMLILLLVQLCLGIKQFVLALIEKKKRRRALIMLLGFSPLLVGTFMDIIVRGIMNNNNHPFFSLFAWPLTIILFIVMLAANYAKIQYRNEYLNKNLRKEVALKTKNLSDANEELEHAMNRANIDLEMASIVQQKFFPFPKVSFRGWDIAICYNPVAKISGDLYDYYYDNNTLNGFALFDVSGHGIAASLITMLAKNVIFRAFDSIRGNRKLSTALYKINEEILEEKGDIENYLTGLLFKFSDFDENDVCTVDMSNAGHPKPFLYNAAEKGIRQIVHDDSQFQYGAIGIKDIDVCFPDIRFKMATDDILVFYTDGLLESMNKEREQFGAERVMKIIMESAKSDARTILGNLIDGLSFFTDGVPLDDDLTIIVLKRENSNEYVDELESDLEELPAE